MAKTKAQKRAAKRKRAQRVSAMAPIRRTRLGRPPTRVDAGPTAQTIAKQRVDTFAALRTLIVDGQPFLDADLIEAGEEVVRAWLIITPPASGCRAGSNGASVDKESSVRLQLIYRRWCIKDAFDRDFNELFRRCMVKPSKVVQWINPKLFGDEEHPADGVDLDPKGSAGVLKRALEWWRLAAREVSRYGSS